MPDQALALLPPGLAAPVPPGTALVPLGRAVPLHVRYHRHPAAILSPDGPLLGRTVTSLSGGSMATWFPIDMAGKAAATLPLPDPDLPRPELLPPEPPRLEAPRVTVPHPPVLSQPVVEPAVRLPEPVAPLPLPQQGWAPVPPPQPLPPAGLASERDLLWPGNTDQLPVTVRPASTLAPREWGVTLPDVTPRPRRVWQGPTPALAGVTLLGLILVGVAAWFAWVGSAGAVTATFNAPMMVVRAAVTGRVTTVAANAGQLVEPRSPLLTIHTNDPGPDQTVLAGVHGVVRSVETVPGADLAAGAALVRVHDCGRAFLTIPADAGLHAGDAVEITLPSLPVVLGTIRAAAGIMEPANALVVGLEPDATGTACPVGQTATVTRPRRA